MRSDMRALVRLIGAKCCRRDAMMGILTAAALKLLSVETAVVIAFLIFVFGA